MNEFSARVLSALFGALLVIACSVKASDDTADGTNSSNNAIISGGLLKSVYTLPDCEETCSLGFSISTDASVTCWVKESASQDPYTALNTAECTVTEDGIVEVDDSAHEVKIVIIE